MQHGGFDETVLDDDAGRASATGLWDRYIRCTARLSWAFSRAGAGGWGVVCVGRWAVAVEAVNCSYAARLARRERVGRAKEAGRRCMARPALGTARPWLRDVHDVHDLARRSTAAAHV